MRLGGGGRGARPDAGGGGPGGLTGSFRMVRQDESNPDVGFPRLEERQPGAPSGLDPHDPALFAGKTGAVRVTCIDYGPEQFHVEEVEDVAAFLDRHRPEWSVVRWIDIVGLGDLE